MEDLARVYAEALFEVAKEAGKLDVVRDQLGEFTDALDANKDMALFFFSPYFSSAEKRDGIQTAVTEAEPEFTNFLEVLVDKHRMPVIFFARRRFDELWAEENKRLEVTVTSAVAIDDAVVEQIGAEISKQTGRTVALNRTVDKEIIGGLVLRVGNMILDASIRSRLEKLRKHVATAA